jgi:hypothetical protein
MVPLDCGVHVDPFVVRHHLGGRAGAVEEAQQAVEAGEHLAERLLLFFRQRTVDSKCSIDVDLRSGLGTGRQSAAPNGGPAARVLRLRAATGRRALIDDLERAVKIGQVAAERLEDLFERVQGRLLFAGFVGREHRLGDSGRVGHLVLPLALAVAQPAQGSPQTMKDWHGDYDSATDLPWQP